MNYSFLIFEYIQFFLLFSQQLGHRFKGFSFGFMLDNFINHIVTCTQKTIKTQTNRDNYASN